MVKQLLFLSPNGLDFYDLNKGQSTHLAFAPTIVNHQEIQDRAQFEKLVGSFLKQVGIRQAVMVLSSALIYDKLISKDQVKPEEVDNLIKDWLVKVPFADQKLSYLKLDSKDGLEVMATNKDLFSSVVKLTQGLGAKIEQVVPATVFGQVNQPLDPGQMHQILSASNLLKKANFLVGQNVEAVVSPAPTDAVSDEPVEGKGGRGRYLIYGLVVVLLFILSGVVGWWKWQEWQQAAKPQIQTPPAESSITAQIATPSAEASESASPSASLTTDLEIQVLNGSGVSGQAGQVKSLLEGLGYQNVVTGNSTGESATATTIEYIESVSQADITAMTDVLAKSLVEVTSAVASPSGSFDVVVTTGQPK